MGYNIITSGSGTGGATLYNALPHLNISSSSIISFVSAFHSKFTVLFSLLHLNCIEVASNLLTQEWFWGRFVLCMKLNALKLSGSMKFSRFQYPLRWKCQKHSTWKMKNTFLLLYPFFIKLACYKVHEMKVAVFMLRWCRSYMAHTCWFSCGGCGCKWCVCFYREVCFHLIVYAYFFLLISSSLLIQYGKNKRGING